MQPTHEMVGDFSSQLTVLEHKVENMDSEWKKEVAVVQSVLKGVAISAELVALIQLVVLLEEHMRHVRTILQLADDE
ncbi:hypothetical protein CJ030_MR2G013644 [Morella rubra]|uniref:Uncharacterized protein n=1 Tax=Morella rubra TaxID=262757 RepID=A0A6A1WCV5_9ROSI|nr:hypothetical protein CJ030_MR2G013644 [Morella rubra]